MQERVNASFWDCSISGYLSKQTCFYLSSTQFTHTHKKRKSYQIMYEKCVIWHSKAKKYSKISKQGSAFTQKQIHPNYVAENHFESKVVH